MHEAARRTATTKSQTAILSHFIINTNSGNKKEEEEEEELCQMTVSICQIFRLAFYFVVVACSLVGNSIGNESSRRAAELLQFYTEEPYSEMDRQCFERLAEGVSIDVIIDIANSPELDEFDKMSAKMPPSEAAPGADDDYLDFAYEDDAKTTADVFFDSINLFLDMLQVDIDPSRLFVVLIDKGQKYYLSGKKINRTRSSTPPPAMRDSDCIPRHTVAVRSRPDDIQMTSLGSLTRLALQARDSGLPIVLRNTKSSQTLYSVLITDGSSGLPAMFLSQDRSKTTIIDIGKRRFLSRVNYSSLMQYAGIITLQHPQQLSSTVGTVRFTACKVVEASTSARH